MRVRSRALRAPLLLLLLAPGAAAAPAAITVEPAGDPVEGREVMLAFTDRGQPAVGLEVVARYREQAHPALRRQVELGATGRDGRLAWVPEQPGVVVLAWEGGSRNFSVLHDGVPAAAVVIAVFAGLVLIGGSVLFFVAMLRDGSGARFEGMAQEIEEAGEPPST